VYIRALEAAVNAVSEPEKKAEQARSARIDNMINQIIGDTSCDRLCAVFKEWLF